MKIGRGVFIAKTAIVTGDVEIGDDSSIWFNSVVRGDLNSIRIGKMTNIQDGVIVHVDEDFDVKIGDRVTVGHSAVVHGCRIDNDVLIGIGSIILNGAEIGEYSIIGAGSVVTGKRYPDRSLILGSPARVVKGIERKEYRMIEKSWRNYLRLKDKYLQNDY